MVITPAQLVIGLTTTSKVSYEVAQADMDLLQAAQEGGVVIVALALVWFFVRRSDTREDKLRLSLQEQLDRAEKAHEETRKQLIELLKTLGEAEPK